MNKIKKSKKLKEVELLIKNIRTDLQKLKNIDVVRSEKYFSDYVEWVVCEILNLKLASNSIQEGWDAKDIKTNEKYQIKYRTHEFKKGSAFDQVKMGKFDFLLGVFINKDSYIVEDIIKVPHNTVFKYTNEMKNRLSFRWRKDTMKDATIEHIYSN